jgi:hypothetical protein
MTTTDITLTGPLEQARGVIGRYPAPDERYVFEFRTVAPRLVHMVGVRRPLRVTWYAGGRKRHQRVLRPWIDVDVALADRIVEAAP